jgi:glucose/arabinose dehydrogenase
VAALVIIASSAAYYSTYAITIGQTTKVNSSAIAAFPSFRSSIINSGPQPSARNFQIPGGYKIEPVLWNLTLSDAVTFDNRGNMYVSEAGYGFGGLQPNPRILKVDTNGTVSILTDRFLNSPIGDMKYHEGKLYVSSKGIVSTVDPNTGLVTDIIGGIPSGGDHPIAQIAFGPDGRLYVAQGSSTNSGVVGLDNYLSDLGWLASFPMVHDVPAKDIALTGQNYDTPNILADGDKNITVTKNNVVQVSFGKNESNYKFGSSDNGTAAISGNNYKNVTTGGFSAFGNKTSAGQIIKGNIRCSACIISSRPDGTDIKVVAWGLRMDAFSGISFDNKGNLIVADSGSEERGSRPIRGDHDKIWKISISNSSNIGSFYGWPDFFYDGNKDKSLIAAATSKVFTSPVNGNKSLQPLLNYPKGLHLPKIFADPGYAVKPTKIASCALPQNSNSSSSPANISSSNSNRSLFIAEYGTHVPTTHLFSKSSNITEYIKGNNGSKILGQKIAILNQSSGKLDDFVSLKLPDPSFRPVGLECSPDGNSLYIVSFAKSEHVNAIPKTNTTLPYSRIWVYPDSGVLWKLSPINGTNERERSGDKNLHLSEELRIGVNNGPPPKTDIFVLPSGYKVKPLLWNLKNPGSFAFDEQGNIYIGNVGFAYNGLFLPPQILKVDHKSGNISIFVDRGLDRPLADITFHDGKLYVSNGGRISTVDKNGIVKDIITSLPGIGDHYVTQIAFAPDGKRFYFGVGVATNSGVVGLDNGWVKTLPKFHDIPGKNITLAGINYLSGNFVTAEKNDSATTGGYVPFGQSTFEGEVIKGDKKCTGCILIANADGTDVKLVAWGLRHPYGLAITPQGKLLVSMNGVDERGIRNIANDGDKVYLIDVTNASNFGKYYGWPDFFGNGEPVTLSKFQSPLNKIPLESLIKDSPPVVRPFAVFDVGAALTQIDFPKNNTFGDAGDAFIGEYGTLAPQTHLTAMPPNSSPGSIMGRLIGQKIITLDPKTGSASLFMSLNTADESFRPTGIKFSPDGKSLYVASVGNNEVRTITPKGGIFPFPMGQPYTYPDTGVIWEISRSS